MKKAFGISLLVIALLAVVVGVCAWNMFGPMVKGAQSVKKLDEGLYYMEYKGEDGLDELIKQGGAENAEKMQHYVINFLSKGYYTPDVHPQKNSYGCSTLTAKNTEGHVMMGRNFDYPSGTAMILHTIPDRGYESIATFNIEFYGFGKDWLPEGFANQYMALSGLFFALDGINEKGFAVADLMAGDNVETHQRTEKPDLTTSTAIRYLLKNAASVDEALQLLQGIDMHSDIGSAHHYAMSDATGRSVVVEYVENKMVVTETNAVTNHYLCDAKHNVGLTEGDKRYDVLCQRYEQSNGTMSEKEFTDAIESVSQTGNGKGFMGTLWTMVMNLDKQTVTYYSRRHYDKPFHFGMTRQ